MSSSDIQALGSGSSIEQSALPSLSRRTFVVAGTAAAAATLISGWLRPAATLATEHAAVSRPAPAGPGSAGGAPGLPRGFSETFTSHYIQAGGLRQHAVIGGDGPPLLLVHGWPQTWYAWRLIMPELPGRTASSRSTSAGSVSPTSLPLDMTREASQTTW